MSEEIMKFRTKDIETTITKSNFKNGEVYIVTIEVDILKRGRI